MRDETMRRSLHSPSDAVLQLALNVSTPDEYDAEKVERLRVHQAAARHGEETPLFKDEIDRDLLSDIAGHWIGAPANARCQRLAARTRSATASEQSPPPCAPGEAIVEFSCPSEHREGTIVMLVGDTFIIHHSKATRTRLEGSPDRLEVCEPPTYAPQINVIELLWTYLRHKVTKTGWFEHDCRMGQASCPRMSVNAAKDCLYSREALPALERQAIERCTSGRQARHASARSPGTRRSAAMQR
jgi:hypothetical protein